MRNKVAKKLRKEAKQIAQSNGLPYVQYGFKQYRHLFTKLTGEVVPHVVYTAYLEDCQRKIYKTLKKEYK